VSATDRRSALVVVAREAEPVVREWRLRYQRESVERGIPPHLTILFPFLPAGGIGEETLDVLRRLYAPVSPFPYQLATVEAFPDAAWLAPQPVEPFLDLIARTRAAFPDRPPYGDPLHVPVPHCTVGIDDDPQQVEHMLGELRRRLLPHLPIQCRATAVALLGELPDGSWLAVDAFPFEAPA
jgi:2'-5' RNA ligase